VKRASALALLSIALAGACAPDAGRPDPTVEAYGRVLESEDARPEEGDRRATLVSAAGVEDRRVRAEAVRALGRLEDPVLAESIAARLDDPDAEVRASAMQALAQAVHGEDGSPVLPVLLGRVEREGDAVARGALARALGALRLDREGRREVEAALVTLGDTSEEETLVGVALGFESLTRLSGGEGLDLPAAQVLDALSSWGGDLGSPVASGRIRALAVEAMGRSRRMTVELASRALADPEPEVRRVAVAYLGRLTPPVRERLLEEALADTTDRVRIAALRYLAGVPRTEARCTQLAEAAGPDAPPAVRMVALEALQRPCPTAQPQRATLVRAVAELGEQDAPWQPAARALLSLTSIDADAADRAVGPFAAHPSPFVRAWAARAASATDNVEVLFRLAVDPDANVRTEAVQGLFSVDGHGVDDFLLEQLESDDPQLLITLARLLEGAPDRARVAEAVLAAFERISQARRETWRDPRIALLGRLSELGDASLATRLEPYLRDYDSVVADSVGALLETWTGREQEVAPAPLTRAPVPSRAELRRWEGATLTLHMQGSGSLVIELSPGLAPTNVARLVRLASEGYFDGLTFHRWAPNFVIQGGSPGANEYQGDAAYTRDEVGGVHWRGTVGVSTRGRDTGDGQIFVNLVDNPRLDDEYTVLGTLIEGYEVLDSILEGAVIERAELGIPAR
jgi:cyclophilin family peptidyl-prolyl cis-trans isomerase/HEAT repeat protein